MSTAFDLAAQRGRLLDRLDEVLRRNGAVARHLRQEDGRLEADFEDRVSFNQADEVLEQLDEDGRAEVGAIRSALDRMDQGAYGTCAACGDAISQARLIALPEAILCIDCATKRG